MYIIGDGARRVRDAFALAKEKRPSIIFIDEILLRTGDRKVNRTMLDLSNQLDGFSENEVVKVINAANLVDS